MAGLEVEVENIVLTFVSQSVETQGELGMKFEMMETNLMEMDAKETEMKLKMAGIVLEVL